MSRFLQKLKEDDRGGETIEYAIVMGLIIVTCIVIVGSVGTQVLARWTSVQSSY